MKTLLTPLQYKSGWADIPSLGEADDEDMGLTGGDGDWFHCFFLGWPAMFVALMWFDYVQLSSTYNLVSSFWWPNLTPWKLVQLVSKAHLVQLFQPRRWAAEWFLENVSGMEVPQDRGNHGVTQIIYFKMIFHSKASILRYAHDLGNPHMWIFMLCWDEWCPMTAIVEGKWSSKPPSLLLNHNVRWKWNKFWVEKIVSNPILFAIWSCTFSDLPWMRDIHHL